MLSHCTAGISVFKPLIYIMAFNEVQKADISLYLLMSLRLEMSLCFEVTELTMITVGILPCVIKAIA